MIDELLGGKLRGVLKNPGQSPFTDVQFSWGTHGHPPGKGDGNVKLRISNRPAHRRPGPRKKSRGGVLRAVPLAEERTSSLSSDRTRSKNAPARQPLLLLHRPSSPSSDN